MTEGSSALGAPTRVEAFDVLNDYTALHALIGELAVVTDLSQIDALRLPTLPDTTAAEIAAAWRTINGRLAPIVEQLARLEATMASRRRGVITALMAADLPSCT